MPRSTTTPTRLLVGVLTVALLAPVAFAAGAPKNQSPCNRPTSIRAHHDPGSPVIQGEPKNMPPFTSCGHHSAKRRTNKATQATPNRWVAAIPAGDI